jgi:Ca2+-binding EF-hand superfamily protein
LAAELTQEETEVYTAAFKQYDIDDSGTIDDEEFSCILEERAYFHRCGSAGIRPTSEEVGELKEKYMPSHLTTATISLHDFLDLMTAVWPKRCVVWA